ncbi:MAG: ABC transporter permease [Clostridiaceae bacterium]|nr:ABC transporter permease [Clostridiaceae bacterium]
MKLSMYRHSFREVLRNLVRHPLVTLASVTTMTLMLFLLGAFIVISMNARHMVELAGQKPPIEITMNIDVAQEDIDRVNYSLEQDKNVIEYQMFSPDENLEIFKEAMEKEDLFEDFSAEYIPYTYTVRLDDPAGGEEFRKSITALPGVREVALEQAVMEFLNKAIRWVNYATLLAFAVLGVIAFFIISNMVRIAVLARSEEIGIMKYVGATNWYIRVPYILEGAVVGLLGALLASLIIWIAYIQLYDNFMPGIEADSVLSMLPAGQLSSAILLITILIGVGVGSIGSVLSVRRHIQV